MTLSMRSYQDEDDYRRLRDFLRQVFMLNHRHIYCWPVARLDYWRWHGIMNLGHGRLETGIYLREDELGRIVAAVNQEDPGQAFIQIPPENKSVELEEEMIIQAEEYLRVPSRKGGKVLWLWCDSADERRQDILCKRGFTHIASSDERQWLRDLEQPIPQTSIPNGYAIRSLGNGTELPARSWASWRAFHSNEPDSKYGGDWNWYQNIQRAPLYRPDLDLVAIAPSGEVAAFTTIWYDEETRSGLFEPVGTVPEHQRRGLARALFYEGMSRLKTLGCSLAMVSGFSVPANALYQTVMGSVHDVSQPWEKHWPA